MNANQVIPQGYPLYAVLPDQSGVVWYVVGWSRVTDLLYAPVLLPVGHVPGCHAHQEQTFTDIRFYDTLAQAQEVSRWAESAK